MEKFLWLEWMNAYIVWLSFAMNLIFAILLIQDRRHHSEMYYDAMIGICVYHMGETARQTWYWIWGHFYDRHPQWLEPISVSLLFLFGLMLTIGALCQIRVFTEYRFGRWIWKAVLATAILMATVMILLPRG